MTLKKFKAKSYMALTVWKYKTNCVYKFFKLTKNKQKTGLNKGITRVYVFVSTFRLELKISNILFEYLTKDVKSFYLSL